MFLVLVYIYFPKKEENTRFLRFVKLFTVISPTCAALVTAISPMCIIWCPISITVVTGLPSRQKKLLLPSQDGATGPDDDDDEGTKMIGLGDVGGDGAGAGAGGDCCDKSFVVNGSNAGGRDDSAELGGDGGEAAENGALGKNDGAARCEQRLG